MAKEHHQSDRSSSELCIHGSVPKTNDVVERPNIVEVVMSFQHATVRVQSGPISTKLSVNGHDYWFDHVTGGLLDVKQ